LIIGAKKMENFDLLTFLFGMANGISWGIIVGIVAIGIVGRKKENETNKSDNKNNR
jgi:hypothetical protein